MVRSEKPRKDVTLENEGLTYTYWWRMVPMGREAGGGNQPWRMEKFPHLFVLPPHTPLWSTEYTGCLRNPFCCPFLLQAVLFATWDFLPGGEVGFLSYHDIIHLDGDLKRLWLLTVISFFCFMWESLLGWTPTRPQSYHPFIHPRTHLSVRPNIHPPTSPVKVMECLWYAGHRSKSFGHNHEQNRVCCP